MILLLLTVFGASLLGSFHCAGMCGPLMLAATDVVQIGPTQRPPRGLYHLGRAFAYAVLGACAGAMGATLDLGATATGLGRIAGPLGAFVVAGYGAVALSKALGRPLPSIPTPRFMQRRLALLASGLRTASPAGRALGMGLLSALLPCGWLYAFAAVAAGAGSALGGAATMLAFWAGTVPALAAVGWSARGALRRWPALRLAAATAVVATGVVLATGRLHADFRVLTQRAASADGALAQAIEEKPACCRR